MDDTRVMSTRLPADLHEWLRREAFELRAPMNAIVVAALEERRSRNGMRGRWIFHKDGDPSNLDPSNLEIGDAAVDSNPAAGTTETTGETT